MAYTATTSVLRAKRLQELCRAENLSAMVFILGIDSRRNRLDEQLFFWLFQGISGEETLRSMSLGLNYEEIAWVITPISFHIYIGSALNNLQDTLRIFKEIQEISAPWTGVHISGLTEEEVYDSELAENNKLLWFNRTMGKIQGPVGVCTNEVEAWPLVQGYAIDLFGLGFFSQTHPPRNISGVLEPIFLEFDDAGVLAVVNEHLPRLCGVFQQASEYINKRNYSAGRGEMTESQIAECFTLPFEYATIQSKKQHPIQPYARLWTSDGSQKVHSAHHLTSVAICGITGLLCARTWFFIPSGGAKEFLSKCYDPDYAEDDLEGLIEVYKGVVKSLRLGILAGGTAKEQTDRILYELYKEKAVTQYHHMLHSVRDAKISFNSYDADGNTVDYNPGLPLHSVLFRASNLGSKDFGNLGEIVFGESFVSRGGDITILTERVDDLVVWESQTKKPSQSPYGERLSTIEHTEVFIEKIGVFEGSLVMYENGWAFRSIHLGQLEYSIDEFFNIEHYSNDVISFFTETMQITIKVPGSGANVLTSVWKIDSTDNPPPDFPVKKQVVLPVFSENPTENTGDRKVPLHLVIGISGSGKTKAAKDIARGLRINCILPAAQQGAHFDESYWREVLNTIEISSVIVLPSYCTPHNLIKILPEHQYISTVICKINARNVFANDRKEFIPGLVHGVQSCSSLIFEEFKDSEYLHTLCGMMNPLMEVFRINGTIGPQQARNIVTRQKPIPVQYPYAPIISMQSVFINIPLSLVESKIKQKLANSEISDDGSLAKRIGWWSDMEIIRIKGCVEFYNKEQTFFEVSGSPTYLLSNPSSTEQPGILFIGRNLNIDKLYDFILDCRSHVSKLPLKNRKMLTQEEVEMVESNLGENSEYIFDGIGFVDMQGKRFKEHPDLENALLDYVDQENDRIGAINRSIEKEKSVIKKANSEVKTHQVFV